jgi:GT2 family glycosyltransferase
VAGPEISVVIPTDQRETRLAFALDALAAQTMDAARFEVIVVRLERVPAPCTTAPQGLNVSFLELGIPNAAAKRNHGWRAARAPVIVFTDDDCRAAPDWLERILEAADGAEVFIQGRTEPDPDESFLIAGRTATQRIAGPSPWYETCNIAYPRALLERLNGFDETFSFGGEDTDLALRAAEARATRVYAHDAVVWHAVHGRSLHNALSTRVSRETQYALFKRHPSQRDALYLRLFWKSSHARLLAALAGAAIMGRRPRALLALSAYVIPPFAAGLRTRELTPRGSIRLAVEIAERFAVDLAEVIASARASARTKTLVL